MVKQVVSLSEGDDDKYQFMDEKKRKRMISNRESAKRSRMRKEEHIKDLNSKITFLSINNNELVRKISSAQQQFSGISLENCKLAKERDELEKRLESLEIVSGYVCEYEKECFPCSSQPWQLNLPHQTLPLVASVGMMLNFE